MSVKDDYERCLSDLESARNIKEKGCNYLSELQSKYTALLDRQAKLAPKTSDEAHKLYTDVSNEIHFLGELIDSVIKGLREPIREHDMLYKKLSKLPEQYIEEQVSLMIKAFTRFVNKNKTKLANNIETKFYIVPETKSTKWNKSGGSYSYPTGNFEIKQSGSFSTIVASSGFPFTPSLYKASLEPDEWWKVSHTYWFKRYHSNFLAEFKKHLLASFKNSPTFKVTFTDNSHFTLELR